MMNLSFGGWGGLLRCAAGAMAGSPRVELDLRDLEVACALRGHRRALLGLAEQAHEDVALSLEGRERGRRDNTVPGPAGAVGLDFALLASLRRLQPEQPGEQRPGVRWCGCPVRVAAVH